MEDRKVILKIEHLCKDFDIKAKSFTGKALKLHALSDISLDIYEGETLGIIGEVKSRLLCKMLYNVFTISTYQN